MCYFPHASLAFRFRTRDERRTGPIGLRFKVHLKGRNMNRTLTILAAVTCSLAAAPVQAAPDMALTRLDWGTPQAPTAVNERFSDTYPYGDLKLQFVFSCYLIKHDNDYLLFFFDQLAKINVNPEQMKCIGISHYRADHTGQVASFPKSTILIGEKEWEAMSAPEACHGRELQAVRELDEGRGQGRAARARQGCFRGRKCDRTAHARTHAGPSSPAREAAADRGRDPQRRRDAFPRELRCVRCAMFNYDRAQSVASMERIKDIASNLKAKVIIQHDARDLEKLPAFPASAK